MRVKLERLRGDDPLVDNTFLNVSSKLTILRLKQYMAYKLKVDSHHQVSLLYDNQLCDETRTLQSICSNLWRETEKVVTIKYKVDV